MSTWKKVLIWGGIIYLAISSPILVTEAVHAAITIVRDLGNTAKQVGNQTSHG